VSRNRYVWRVTATIPYEYGVYQWRRIYLDRNSALVRARTLREGRKAEISSFADEPMVRSEMLPALEVTVERGRIVWEGVTVEDHL
jgi:hypothetical protein